MIGHYFSVALCSATHHGVQLRLGMYQGGSPFALVETGIHDQYTSISRLSQFQVLSVVQFNSGESPILTIGPQLPSSITYKIKMVGNVLQIQIEVYSRVKKKYRCLGLDETSRLI